MINSITIVGTIAYEPTSNDKQTAATIHVNVRRNFKPEGEQYYPTDKIVCKALSERNAKRVMTYFSKNDIVVVTGKMQYSVNPKKEDGKGDWELIIDNIDGPFAYKNTKKEEGGIVTPEAPSNGLPMPNRGLPMPTANKSVPPVPPAPPRAGLPVPPAPPVRR